jgi:hypothetical protein
MAGWTRQSFIETLYKQTQHTYLYSLQKITNRDRSPFWESFMWKFAQSTSNILNSIVDFTNIIETSSSNNKGSRKY